DLALHLAAPDLGANLTRFADALGQTLSELDDHIRRSRGRPSVEDETARDDAVEQLLDLRLSGGVRGSRADGVDRDADGVGMLTELPTGTLDVAELRDAPRDARVDVIDAELPGDPLDWHLAWREAGLVVCLVGG